VISDDNIDLVYVASNHASHATYAIDCIGAGKHVHIEMPHVVSQSQLNALELAMSANPDARVFLGFNRPRSRLFQVLKEHLDRESGPAMINWFIAGHAIPDGHWYFDQSEGGRVLGNLCHWTDLTLRIVGLEHACPCEIVPLGRGSKSDFAVSIQFADSSCASITFSAKGHTFDGVREVLNIHKGNLIGNLTDFHSLELDVGPKKIALKPLFRDHGHRANVINSLTNMQGESPAYVLGTARLFLAVKDALDTGACVRVA